MESILLAVGKLFVLHLFSNPKTASVIGIKIKVLWIVLMISDNYQVLPWQIRFLVT